MGRQDEEMQLAGRLSQPENQAAKPGAAFWLMAVSQPENQAAKPGAAVPLSLLDEATAWLGEAMQREEGASSSSS
jgi:hypothetical protein